MHRHPWMIVTLLVLLLGSSAPGQDEAKPPGAPPEEETTPAERAYDDLTTAYQEARRQHVDLWRQRVADAKAAREKGEEVEIPAYSTANVREEFIPRFRAGAERFAGAEGAVPFLLWISGNADDEGLAGIIDTLMEDHLQSPKLGRAAALIGRRQQVLGEERVQELLARILEENEHPDVRGQVLLTRGSRVLEDEDDWSAEEITAAVADLKRAAATATDPQLVGRAEGILFARTHLQVGLHAPEIEGTDLDGEPMKLSDFRGKVVLLDFWGDW